MIKKIIFTFSIAFLSVAVFSQSDEKANVLAVEKTVADAFTKHNAIAINAAFADDATIISATGEIVNKQQLIQTIQNINSATVSDLKVRIEGIIAIVSGTEVEAGKDANGIAYTNKTRFTDVLEKTKGQWIIISSQATAMQ